MLREKVKQFLEISKIPKTQFCKSVAISTVHFYGWLSGERELSDDAANRIRVYIKKYTDRLNSF